MRVLFVEDGTEVREETTERLVRLGHTVVAIDKAEDAFAELGRGTFDLILTDNDTKSKMTGLELVQKIRTDSFFHEIAKIPVIVQTGDAIEQKALDLKAVFLPKPWRMEQLIAALDTAILQQTGSLFRI